MRTGGWGGLVAESPKDNSKPARGASFSPPNSPREHFLRIRESTGDFSILQIKEIIRY